MKRPARAPSQLSESLHRRLNAYALAASAAGVGALALAQPAEGKIVYTPTHVRLERRADHYIDLNHDGIFDFRVSVYQPASTWGRMSVFPVHQKNGIASSAAALSSGVQIGPGLKFQTRKEGMCGFVFNRTQATTLWGGPWCGLKDRYLGLKFIVQGKVHYGWARLNVNEKGGIVAWLTGYAYETIPNKPIIAGKTHGPADDSTLNPDSANPADFGPGASANSIPDTPQPASLGMLALGAQGVPLWRRKETAVESD